MVNDRSTKKFLYGPLKEHIDKHLKHIVKLYELPVRSGLIWARLAGARAASGDVLVFLDSHTGTDGSYLKNYLCLYFKYSRNEHKLVTTAHRTHR